MVPVPVREAAIAGAVWRVLASGCVMPRAGMTENGWFADRQLVGAEGAIPVGSLRECLTTPVANAC